MRWCSPPSRGAGPWRLYRRAAAYGDVRLMTASISMGSAGTVRARRTHEEAVQAYVPDVVRALAAGQAEWLAELRRVTAIFVNLLDDDPAPANLLEPVQLTMAAIQPILQRYEGSLKQVVVDDKGLTLIAVLRTAAAGPRGRPGPCHPGRARGCRRPCVSWGCVARSARHRAGVLR